MLQQFFFSLMGQLKVRSKIVSMWQFKKIFFDSIYKTEMTRIFLFQQLDELVCEMYESQLFIDCVCLKFYIVLRASQGN